MMDPQWNSNCREHNGQTKRKKDNKWLETILLMLYQSNCILHYPLPLRSHSIHSYTDHTFVQCTPHHTHHMWGGHHSPGYKCGQHLHPEVSIHMEDKGSLGLDRHSNQADRLHSGLLLNSQCSLCTHQCLRHSPRSGCYSCTSGMGLLDSWRSLHTPLSTVHRTVQWPLVCMGTAHWFGHIALRGSGYCSYML